MRIVPPPSCSTEQTVRSLNSMTTVSVPATEPAPPYIPERALLRLYRCKICITWTPPLGQPPKTRHQPPKAQNGLRIPPPLLTHPSGRHRPSLQLPDEARTEMRQRALGLPLHQRSADLVRRRQRLHFRRPFGRTPDAHPRRVRSAPREGRLEEIRVAARRFRAFE